MIKKEEIKKLADLSRITLSLEEIESLQGEIDVILEYVSEVNNVPVDNSEKLVGDVFNVTRKDENPHDGGVFTDDLLREVPELEGSLVKVKRILE